LHTNCGWEIIFTEVNWKTKAQVGECLKMDKGEIVMNWLQVGEVGFNLLKPSGKFTFT